MRVCLFQVCMRPIEVSVNAFLVGRTNVLCRINGGPLEAIEHACQTLEVDDMCDAKLEELSSGPLEINHIWRRQ